MELLTNKKFVQKMIIALVFVILFNFVSPQISFASWGGTLFEPVKDLSLSVGDAIVYGMQKFIFDMDKSVMKIKYDKDWSGIGRKSSGSIYRWNCNSGSYRICNSFRWSYCTSNNWCFKNCRSRSSCCCWYRNGSKLCSKTIYTN